MPTLPTIRATKIEASNPSERDKTVPTNDQKVPRINRAASGDASRRRLVPRKAGGQKKSTVSRTLNLMSAVMTLRLVAATVERYEKKAGQPAGN
jgi:hypothetical protein